MIGENGIKGADKVEGRSDTKNGEAETGKMETRGRGSGGSGSSSPSSVSMRKKLLRAQPAEVHECACASEV